MLTQEQRTTMSAMWLAHWRGWQGFGVSMAEYARRGGSEADAAYRWGRALRRTGQSVEADGAPAVSKSAALKKQRPVRFARIAVSAAASRIDVAAAGVDKRPACGARDWRRCALRRGDRHS